MRNPRTPLSLAVLLAFLATVGCGGETSRTQRACDRAQTCNRLDGVSVEQCTDAADAALRNVTSAQRADWERAVDACLALQDCGNFVACMNAA